MNSDENTIIADSETELTSRHNQNSGKSQPVLIQYNGASPGKRFVLSEMVSTIGRKAEAVQLWVDDPSVSREHCRLQLSEGRVIVTDLGSLNNTFVNDQKVSEDAELCHGDMLRVGNVRLKFYAHGNSEALLVDRIYRMAVQDRMLEIFRREYLDEKLEEEFRLAKSKNSPLSLMFIDLDKFKNVNDTYGHDAGDLILKEVCNLIKSMVRQADTFGRYGGEEFCLIVPNLGLLQTVHLAEFMRQSVQDLVIEYQGQRIPITASLGVATLTPNMNSAAELLKCADELVYRSKREGRNRVSAP